MGDSKTSSDDDKPGIVSKALTVAAFPTAAFIGATRAKSDLAQFTHNKIKSAGMLNDIELAAHRADGAEEQVVLPKNAFQSIKAKERSAGKSALEKVKQGIAVDFPAEMSPIKKETAAAYKERIKMLKLDSMSQKWKYLEDHEKWPVVMNGLEAVAITLGAMLFLAESKKIARLFDDDGKQKNSDAPAR